ncbi:expressed protein [Echinococcus multilocularis]|uniref:Expressed protein n=1 Tax=Echinococcus multilocularis TaxID=6211 RepID=A0A068XV77_ECHMU|nr:expressed protein [Echinococcus multilocularis]
MVACSAAMWPVVGLAVSVVGGNHDRVFMHTLSFVEKSPTLIDLEELADGVQACLSYFLAFYTKYMLFILIVASIY